MRTLRRDRVAGAVTGGNDRSRQLDIEYGLDEYVHLSLTPYHPMQYVALRENRVRSLVDIVVDAQVLARPHVMMTFDIANKFGGSRLLPVKGWAASQRVGILYRDPADLDAKGKARVDDLRRYEILVPDFIEPAFLRFGNQPL